MDELEQVREAAEEQRLVDAALRGSQSAFERLYRIHAGAVHALCLRLTGNPATAEDCVQDTFIQAWRSLGRFERRSRLRTWLHRIAVNTALMHGRRRGELLGLEASADELAAQTLGDADALDIGAALDLDAAIATLPPGARQVLVLCGVYGYAHEEAAAALGIAVGTCKAQLHRARQLLASRMARRHGESLA